MAKKHKIYNYIKYPNIPYLKDMSSLIKGRLYEKIDGSNCQIRIDNNRLLPGTRSKRVEDYQNPVDWMVAFQKKILTNNSFYNLGEGYVLFLEYLSNHNIRYYPSEFYSSEIFIDLFDIKDNKFMDYEDAKSLLEKKNIRGIHVLDSIDDKSVHSYEDIVELTNRQYHKKPQFERFVIKDYETQKLSKFVVEQVDPIMETFITLEVLNEAISIIRQQKTKPNLADIVASIVKKNTSRYLHNEIVTDYLVKRRLI